MKAAIAITVLVLVGVAHAPAARAGDDIGERVKTHMERGVEFYAEKQFELAIVEFRAAYALDPRPDFLFALAQAERLSGDCSTAVVYYERFLDTEPSREQAEAARVNMRRCDRALESGPDGRRLVPTGEVLDRAAAAAPPDPPPAVQPSAGGVTARREAEPAWYRDPVGGVFLAGGVLGLGLGGGFLAAAGAADRSADSAPNYDAYTADIERAKRNRGIGAAGLVAGIGLSAAAGLRYWRVGKRSRERSLGMGAGPTDGGAAVTLVGRF